MSLFLPYLLTVPVSVPPTFIDGAFTAATSVDGLLEPNVSANRNNLLQCPVSQFLRYLLTSVRLSLLTRKCCKQVWLRLLAAPAVLPGCHAQMPIPAALAGWEIR